jgi:hypothetical protein
MRKFVLSETFIYAKPFVYVVREIKLKKNSKIFVRVKDEQFYSSENTHERKKGIEEENKLQFNV